MTAAGYLLADSGTGGEPERERVRVARDVRAVDLDAYQRTVRRLLAHPLVRADERELLAAIRRFETDLRRDLSQVARYTLDIGSGGVRLVRTPLVLDPHQPARSAGQARRPFDPRRYAYLCLTLSSLLRSGAQVLLSELARRLADDASRIVGLGFDRDEHAHRVAFVDVVRWLEANGAMRFRDGSDAADLDEDALYDVEHEVVHLLVPSLGLRDLSSIEDRFVDVYGESRDERRARARHRVTRLVLERPCVLYADLDDDERSWVQRNLGRLADDIERLTGLQLERRREGVALIDTAGDATDRSFPASGSPTQLALLLGERLLADEPPARAPLPRRVTGHVALVTVLDEARRAAGTSGDGDGQPRDATATADVAATTEGGATAPAWPLERLEAIVAELVEANPGVRRELRENTVEATRVAVAELLAFDLVRLVPAEAARSAVFVPTPPLGRFRPVVPAPAPAPADDQLDLFGEPT